MSEVNRTKSLSNSGSSYTDFYYHFFRNILVVALPLLVISAIVLSSIHSSATGSGSGTDSLTISISSACTLGSVVDTEHNTSTNVGTYTSDIGKTTIKTLCNDGNGYAVYANGYSNNEEGNNKLINTEYPQYSIDTGLATSGLTSAWAMKLNNIPDDPSPTPPTIESDYNNVYGIVPPYWTKVAGRQSGTTDMAEGSSFTTTYAVYASSSQYAGTYQGQVKYILVHPSSPFKNLTMQSIATWKDSVLPNEGDSAQAIDERDGKMYWVTRLADGHIWMTQNLDFDIDTNTTLNSETTDLNVAYNSTTGDYPEYNNGYTVNNNIIYWKPANSANTIDFQNTGPVTGWQSGNTTPYSTSKTDSAETGHASLGNYYNWTASIASNDSSSLTQDTLNDISKNPQNSICPKGWRLPTISSQSETESGSTNEFIRLNHLYNNILDLPSSFQLGGFIDGQLSYYGSVGDYWSSTIRGSNNAAHVTIRYNSTINNINSKSYGFNMRCIAR